jgi:hypothetical protein
VVRFSAKGCRVGRGVGGGEGDEGKGGGEVVVVAREGGRRLREEGVLPY